MTTALVPPSAARAIGERDRFAVGPRQGRRVTIRLWIPLTALIVVLSPLLLLATTIAALHPRLRRMRAHRFLPATSIALSSLSGSLIEVEARRASIRLRII